MYSAEVWAYWWFSFAVSILTKVILTKPAIFYFLNTALDGKYSAKVHSVS